MAVNKSSKKNKRKKNANNNLDLKEEVINDNVSEEVIKEETKEIPEKNNTNNEANVSNNDNVQETEDNSSEKIEEVKAALEENKLTSNDKKTSKKWKFILILVSLIILLLSLGLILFPRIKLNGQEQVTMTYNDVFVDPGYNVYVLNKKISKDVKVNSNINPGVVGNYEVNYYFNFLGIKIKKIRKVNIIDNVKPVLNTDSDIVQVCPNKDIPNIEYTAIDEYDGDITSNVEKIVNDNEILFKVKDNNNNFSSLSVKINREDTEMPVIKLKGSPSMFITYGNSYKEPGYTASDNCDGDITSKVLVSGSVGREIGKYQIKYEVEDASKNKTSVIRTIVVGTKVVDNGSINKGTIYLTFDDGPNQGTTNKILDILKSEGVKATFFVTCKGPDSLIKRMYDEGHTVALHTASHEYSYVYSSVDNYFNDLYKVRDRVKRITGVDSKIIRFPGGSSNTISRNYSKGIMTVLTNMVLNEEYRYFDWNVDGMDASSAKNSKDVYYNVTSNLSHNRANVVLLHDIKSITASALKDIIKFGKEYGYEFREIDMNTYMVRHSVNN